MLSFIKKYFTAPVFPGNEEKTRRASLLSVVINGIIFSILLVLVGIFVSGRTPASTILLNVCTLILIIIFRYWLAQGRLNLVGLGIVTTGFVSISALVMSLGTIRTPTATAFLFIIIFAGIIFDLNGVIASTFIGSLIVGGLIYLENAGFLPKPDYTVTITQWVVYSGLFMTTGGLAFYTNRTTKNALLRAEHENEVRERIEAEMRKLTRAVEQSPASIVITDLQGSIEYVNPRFTHVTGYTLDEAIGNNPRILKTDLTPPATYRTLWDNLTTGKEWRGEFTNRKKDGSTYYESATISPITDLNGQTTHYLAVKLDITEQKNAEKALRESEERFRMMFENHNAPMLLVDPASGQIFDANFSAQEFYGYQRDQFKTMSIAEINTLPADLVKRELQRAVNKDVNTFIFSHRLASGEIRTVEVHSSPLLLNDKVALFSIIHDITDRQRMENALREAQARWQFALEGAGDGVWDWDCQTGRVYYSKQWKAMLGYAEHEVGDRPDEWRSRLHPDDLAKGIGSGSYLGAENTIFTNEYRLKCKDGKYKWILDRGKVIQCSQDHQPLRVIGTHTDITERKRNETILQIRLELLEYAHAHTLSALLQQALDKLGTLTESPISFYHIVDPDQKTLTLQAYSTQTSQKYCQVDARSMHSDLQQAGLWAECVHQRKPVIHNDYASTPNRSGLPDGHAPLLRELVVPVFREGRVVSIIGLGNKPIDYSEADVFFVSYFADLLWDIAERKIAEEALSISEARSRALFEQSHDAVFILNLTGHFLAANQRACDMFGYDPREIINLSVNDTSAEQDQSRLVLSRLLGGDHFPIYERLFRKKDGSTFPAEVNLELVKDKSGNPLHIQSVVRDISARKATEHALRHANEQLNLHILEVERLQDELREQALHDPLTGLYNRRYLGDTLEREILRAAREQTPVSIIVTDVDWFKNINDRFGHHAGDKALKAIASLMRNHARGSDFACRYGGEEFLLVLPGVTLEAAAKRAELIRQKCKNMVIEYEGQQMRLTMSIGVASYPRSGMDAEQVTKKADKALYRSKDDGRNRVTICTDQAGTSSE